jgi:hypothetical protein
MGTASQEGSFGIVWAASARAGRQRACMRGTRGELIRFVHSNQQRCESDRTTFVMVDTNFQATHVRWAGTPRAAAVGLEVPPGATCSQPRAPESLASTQLASVEVCRGGVFACSIGAMDASRSKSCREPFRGELRENWGQTWSQ